MKDVSSSYDFVIVCTNNEKQCAYWQSRLDDARGSVLAESATVIAVRVAIPRHRRSCRALRVLLMPCETLSENATGLRGLARRGGQRPRDSVRSPHTQAWRTHARMHMRARMV